MVESEANQLPEEAMLGAVLFGHDQMQALTGLFAKQYGTPNYAAHGGFCSVNMAAGMIYTSAVLSGNLVVRIWNAPNCL